MKLGRELSRRRTAKYIVSPRAPRRKLTPMAIMIHGPNAVFGGGTAASIGSRTGSSGGLRAGSRADTTRGEMNPGAEWAKFVGDAGGSVTTTALAIIAGAS
jgi:hypothetical protein